MRIKDLAAIHKTKVFHFLHGKEKCGIKSSRGTSREKERRPSKWGTIGRPAITPRWPDGVSHTKAISFLFQNSLLAACELISCYRLLFWVNTYRSWPPCHKLSNGRAQFPSWFCKEARLSVLSVPMRNKEESFAARTCVTRSGVWDLWFGSVFQKCFMAPLPPTGS